ncbi:MAG: hypothetical protein Q4C29_00285 [bacterium]|nr:hypothetical protein [bacterium]
MESRENSQKRILLSVLGVAILVVAVVGISFAAYTGSNTGNVNKVSTGTITFSYAEPENGITLSDAASISDAAGKSLTNKFDFTVTTTTTNALTIPYVVTLTKDASNTLSDDAVSVYVTKNSDADVVKDVTKVSALSAYTRGADTTNTKLLFDSSHVHTATATNNTVTTNYSFRMWVNQSATLDSSKTQTFKALINVDSTVNAQ